MTTFNIAGEGILDLACAEKMLASVGAGVGRRFDKRGHARLDQQIPAYNQAAQYGDPWLVLRDYDRFTGCAGTLFGNLLGSAAHANFVLRFPVQSIESWIMGDRERAAEMLSVSPAHLPADPDTCPRPKDTLIAIARRSRRREIREGIVPRDALTALGPEYNLILNEFILERWRPSAARESSRSLDRALRRLEAFAG